MRDISLPAGAGSLNGADADLPRDPSAPSAAETPDLRSRVSRWVREEIAPLAEDIDRSDRFPRELWPKLGAAGLLGIAAPKSVGGSGHGLRDQLLVMEEISRASASIGLSWAAHANFCLSNLVRHGNGEQRERYARPLCTGASVGALAMSEPGAGSDIVGSMQCRASLHGDTWIASGRKSWITNAPDADVLVVYMRTGDEGHGITAFIVEPGMQGFRGGSPADKLGMRGSGTGDLVFENCEIPAGNILGKPGHGLEILMAGLDTERVVLSGGPIGIMHAALELALPHARARRQFGRPIGTFELVQAKLADMYTALEASRAFSYRVAEAFDNGVASRRDAAACLLFASGNAMQAASDAIQILGARGYMNDSPAGRLLRDAKVYDIGGGTREIRRILIGRDLVGEAA